jgi:hypothetical protein
MHDTYIILRDNKEKGPFTLAELLQLPLLPRDLIWIEGKSSSWNFPSEIDDLKSYINGEGQAPKKPISCYIEQNFVTIDNSVEKSVSVPLQTGETLDNTSSLRPVANEELTADDLERKANEIYQRVMVYAREKEQNEKKQEIKYSPAQQSEKEKKADKVPKRKRQGSIALAAAVLAVGITGMAALFFMANKPATGEIKLPVSTDQYATNAGLSLPPETTKNENEQHPVYIAPKEPVETAIPARKELTVDEFIDSVEQVLARQNRIANTIKSPKKGGTATYNIKNEKTPESSITETATKEIVPYAEQKKVPLFDLVNFTSKYLYRNNKQTASGLEVTVHNNSSQPLKLVTVDVFYYKKNEKLIDQETLYFRNIGSKSFSTVSTSGKRKIVSARLQLGQVSAAQGN